MDGATRNSATAAALWLAWAAAAWSVVAGAGVGLLGSVAASVAAPATARAAAAPEADQDAEPGSFDPDAGKGVEMSFQLHAPAFAEGTTIPARFTCDGADLSPELIWTDPPEQTKSLCLLMDDPDAPAGIWTHWMLWNLPDSARALPEGVVRALEGPAGSRQGTSDFRRPGYGGPCPPPGPAHRYYFKLFALDGPLVLKAGATRKEFDAALRKRKILGQATCMGRYARLPK